MKKDIETIEKSFGYKVVVMADTNITFQKQEEAGELMEVIITADGLIEALTFDLASKTEKPLALTISETIFFLGVAQKLHKQKVEQSINSK